MPPTPPPNIYSVAQNAKDAASILTFLNWVVTSSAVQVTWPGSASLMGTTMPSGDVLCAQFYFSVPAEHAPAIRQLLSTPHKAGQ